MKMKMARLILIVVVLAVVLSGCKNSDDVCENNWAQMDVSPGEEEIAMYTVLNGEWPPDSVGATLQKCVEEGWTGWRD